MNCLGLYLPATACGGLNVDLPTFELLLIVLESFLVMAGICELNERASFGTTGGFVSQNSNGAAATGLEMGLNLL